MSALLNHYDRSKAIGPEATLYYWVLTLCASVLIISYWVLTVHFWQLTLDCWLINIVRLALTLSYPVLNQPHPVWLRPTGC